jgi:thiol-disulfide isomerase/thioredoxin
VNNDTDVDTASDTAQSETDTTSDTAQSETDTASGTDTTHVAATTLAETTLETLRPASDWSEAAHTETVEGLSELAASGAQFHVWSGDWCPDCRRQLPAFAAAVDAAEVPPEAVTVYPVERGSDGKVGPGMDEFDVSLIPTVIVERDGTEVARFEESGPLPIAASLVADSE